jgi:tetratricopeptide (TPR) repeat protein
MEPKSASKRLELALMLFWLDQIQPSRARNQRALRVALKAAEMGPSSPLAQGLAGWLLWANGQTQRAIFHLRQAVELQPKEIAYAAALLTSLAMTRGEAELRRCLHKAAHIHRVNLTKVRKQLRARRMRTDVRTVLANAFPTIYWLRSLLTDEAERVENRVHRGKPHRQVVADLRRARREPVERSSVPGTFRPLLPLARRWGIGDDALRAFALSRITRSEREKLRRMLPARVRRAVHDWLGTFQAGVEMPPGAARFLYLLEAYEETFVLRNSQ